MSAADNSISTGVESLRRQAFELSRDDQYRLAFFIAEHIGFGLVRCTCGSDGGDHDISCPSAISGVAQAPQGPMVPWELKCLREVCAAPECDCPPAHRGLQIVGISAAAYTAKEPSVEVDETSPIMDIVWRDGDRSFSIVVSGSQLTGITCTLDPPRSNVAWTVKLPAGLIKIDPSAMSSTQRDKAAEEMANRWPLGCHSPNSCSRSGCCMYVGCKHDGEDIKALATAFSSTKGK